MGAEWREMVEFVRVPHSKVVAATQSAGKADAWMRDGVLADSNNSSMDAGCRKLLIQVFGVLSEVFWGLVAGCDSGQYKAANEKREPLIVYRDVKMRT